MSGGMDAYRPERCDGCGEYKVTYILEDKVTNRWHHACLECQEFALQLPLLTRSIWRAGRRAEVAKLAAQVSFEADVLRELPNASWEGFDAALERLAALAREGAT